MNKFYKSKILMEIEVEHQFDLNSAIQDLYDHLKYTAIKSKKVLNVTTNYKLHSEPLETFYFFDLESLN